MGGYRGYRDHLGSVPVRKRRRLRRAHRQPADRRGNRDPGTGGGTGRTARRNGNGRDSGGTGGGRTGDAGPDGDHHADTDAQADGCADRDASADSGSGRIGEPVPDYHLPGVCGRQAAEGIQPGSQGSHPDACCGRIYQKTHGCDDLPGRQLPKECRLRHGQRCGRAVRCLDRGNRQCQGRQYFILRRGLDRPGRHCEMEQGGPGKEQYLR